MINSVKAGTGAPDAHTDGRSKRDDHGSSPPQEDEAPKSPPPQEGADLRLVIERDLERGDYLYRLIDRSTGRVMAELPRHKVADLAKAATYTAGALVSTKA